MLVLYSECVASILKDDDSKANTVISCRLHHVVSSLFLMDPAYEWETLFSFKLLHLTYFFLGKEQEITSRKHK